MQLELTQSWYSHSWDTRLVVEGFSDEMEMLEKCLLQALREQYECLCHSVKRLGYKLTEGTYPAEYDENLFTRATVNITLTEFRGIKAPQSKKFKPVLAPSASR
ncbi:hypothetical protein [Serratia fonticola]|uniref:hypothetical protein n=1 Tax=Serratia fonticola TaxID=47917 RepID=UPI00192D1213|nr:hypothetical protein [Serratia fonticola]MBL5829188.1 hypothetical protein [Serratia fonticola]